MVMSEADSAFRAAQEFLIRSFTSAFEQIALSLASGAEPEFRLTPAGGDYHGLNFEGDIAPDCAWHLRMNLTPELRVVAHGHSASLWLGEVQVAELHVESTTAATLSLNEGDLSLRQIGLHGVGGSVKIVLRLDAFLLTDRGVGQGKLNWRRHNSARSLNYLLDDGVPSTAAGKLLVVFSAIGAEYDYTFNYRASLAGPKLTKAYILDDFGRQGSYYWVDHGDESIFRGTQELLTRLVEELGLDWSDVMFAGSSKGGTAALLHGVTLGVGRILLGAPQYRVGDYLSGAAPQILEFMTGGASDEDRVALNGWAKHIVLNGQRRSAIRVVVGTADHHLVSHVTPLLEDAVEAGYKVDSLVLSGVPHGEIGWVFKHLLSAEAADHEVGSAQDPLPYSLTRNEDIVTFRCWPAEGESLAVHVFGKTGVLERYPYSTDDEIKFHSAPEHGPVRVRVFRRSDADTQIRAFTTSWV